MELNNSNVNHTNLGILTFVYTVLINLLDDFLSEENRVNMKRNFKQFEGEIK